MRVPPVFLIDCSAYQYLRIKKTIDRCIYSYEQQCLALMCPLAPARNAHAVVALAAFTAACTSQLPHAGPLLSGCLPTMRSTSNARMRLLAAAALASSMRSSPWGKKPLPSAQIISSAQSTNIGASASRDRTVALLRCPAPNTSPSAALISPIARPFASNSRRHRLSPSTNRAMALLFCGLEIRGLNIFSFKEKPHVLV